jgi:hypothetical protein
LRAVHEAFSPTIARLAGLAFALCACGDVLGIPEATRLPPSVPDASIADDASAPDSNAGEAGLCGAQEKACPGALGCVPIDSTATGCGDMTSCAECSSLNATGEPKCVNGECTVGQCNDGFAHCSAHASDGCEANLNSDDNHCSACDVDCTPAGGDCEQGRCHCSNLNDGETCDRGVSCDGNGDCAN